MSKLGTTEKEQVYKFTKKSYVKHTGNIQSMDTH